MTARTLRFAPAALRDLHRRIGFIKRERGRDFALNDADAFIAWLKRVAKGGAQLGTELPAKPGYRSFGYKKQTTVVACFTDDELRVMRIYFADRIGRRGRSATSPRAPPGRLS